MMNDLGHPYILHYKYGLRPYGLLRFPPFPNLICLPYRYGLVLYMDCSAAYISPPLPLCK